MNFVWVAFGLSVFLTAYGLIFFYFSRKLSNVQGLIKPSMILAIIGCLYLALAHVSALTGSGETLFLTNMAPCENIVVNSTDLNATVTSYEYEDSCADRTLPAAAENLHVIFMYLLWIDFAVIFAGMIYGVSMLLKRW